MFPENPRTKNPENLRKADPLENAKYFKFSENDETETVHGNIEVPKEKVSAISESSKSEKTKDNIKEKEQRGTTQKDTR